MQETNNPFQVTGTYAHFNGEQEYMTKATALRRLSAHLLNVMIILVVIMPLVLAFGSSDDDPELLTTLVFLAFLVLFCVNCIFLAKTGQSLGKKMVGIRIVMLDGDDAPLWRILLLRNAVPFILGMIPFFSLIDILFIFGSEIRCIHDYLAGTIVIEC